jgi:hypothetical protein
MVDANAALTELRAAYKRWTEADPHSDEEWYAATDLCNGFDAMDRHLSDGGSLPADWDVAPPGPAWLTPAVAEVIRRHVELGQRIAAIKEIRTVSGTSLRAAKDWLDEHYPYRPGP